MMMIKLGTCLLATLALLSLHCAAQISAPSPSPSDDKSSSVPSTSPMSKQISAPSPSYDSIPSPSPASSQISAPSPSDDSGGVYTPSESPVTLPGSEVPSQSPSPSDDGSSSPSESPATLPRSSAPSPSDDGSTSPSESPATLPRSKAPPSQSPSPSGDGSSSPSISPSDDVSSSPSHSPAGSSDCKDLLVNNLFSCITFLTEGPVISSSPDDTCCEGYKKVAKTFPDCICKIIEHQAEYYLVFNMTRVLAMPTLCNYDAPPLHCILSESPVPSPGSDHTLPEPPATPSEPQTSNISPPESQTSNIPPRPLAPASAQAASDEGENKKSGAYTLSSTFAVASALLVSFSVFA